MIIESFESKEELFEYLKNHWDRLVRKYPINEYSLRVDLHNLWITVEKKK